MTPTTSTHGPESDDGRQDAPGATDAATEAAGLRALDPSRCTCWPEGEDPGHDGDCGAWLIGRPSAARATDAATEAREAIDLDAVEAQARHWDHLIRDDPATTLALVRELREARAERDDLRARLAKVEVHPVVVEIADERARQLAKHGDQSNLPNGTAPCTIFLDLPHYQGHARADHMADWAKARTDAASHSQGDGTITFEHILTEEWAEAIAEDDDDRLRAELVQVAAVAVQWIEAIDLRAALRGDR